MPVNIFDIPSEEKTSQKALSLWVEFGICVCIIAVYVCVFLVYFSEYLSKNNYAFEISRIIMGGISWCSAES